MTADLLATTFTAWGLLSVAAVGIAVLPWTDRELEVCVAAYATAGRIVRWGVLAVAR